MHRLKPLTERVHQTFHLLTGQQLPFLLETPASSRLAVEQAVIKDKDIPIEWLNDPSGQDISAGAISNPTAAGLEDLLSGSLSRNEAEQAAVFIRDCLRLDPNRRPTADECLRHNWLSAANACSCGYC